jgi:hypothetical protein
MSKNCKQNKKGKITKGRHRFIFPGMLKVITVLQSHSEH